VCPGRLSAPIAKRGFVVSSIDPTKGLPCARLEACLGGSNSGNSSCGPGYSGNRCARCTEGKYLLYNRCETCGISALIWIFSVILPIIAVMGVSLNPLWPLRCLCVRVDHALPTEAVTVGALLCSPHSAFIALRNWNAAGQEMRCVDSKHTIGMRLCSIRSTWGVHGPFSAKRDLVLFVALTQAFGDDPSALHIAGSFVRFHLGHSTPFTIPPVHG
jgi:hypothetical protein